jgi:hypothetical protein
MSTCSFTWLSGYDSPVARILLLGVFCYPLLYWEASPSKTWTNATVLNKLQMSHPVAHDAVATIFAPGVGAAFHQSAKYAGKYGVLSATAKIKTHIPSAPVLIYNVHPSDGLGDVLYVVPGTLGFYASLPIRIPFMIMDYVYGMRDSPSWLHLWYKIDLSGERTVNDYISQVEECANQNPSKRLVLFGTSNGASTVVVALSKLSQDLLDRIALVVLEAPYDTVHHVARKRFGLGAKFIDFLLSWFTRYDPHQKTPLDAIANISDKIPIAFVTVKDDTHVHYECTMTLVAALKKKRNYMGHDQMIHRLHLVRGAGHSDTSINNEDDAVAYKNFMDALYTEYLKPNA